MRFGVTTKMVPRQGVLYFRLTAQDPDGEIENSEKRIFEIRIPNFCYIQVIVFDLSYLPVAVNGT